MINLFIKIKLYLNTIKFLDNKQIFYYIYYNIKKRFFFKKKIIHFSDFTINHSRKKKIEFIKNELKVDLNNSEFIFLNKSKKINLTKNWNPIKTDKLWIYNLHYFDYILSSQFLNNKNLGISLIENWIFANKFNYGNGWEPYTISIRIVNWIKFFLLSNIEPNKNIKNSIIRQALYLEKNFEYHILANHILANIKAIIFFNLFYKSKHSKKKIIQSDHDLNKQINIQILNDGYHYEQSPYYHSIVLSDFIDIINIKKIYGQTSPIKKSLILKMILCLKKTTHQNGRLANFNDVQHLSDYKYKALIGYYQKILKSHIKLGSNLIKKNPSGFYNKKISNLNLICFFGSICCNHQPGHSHSNTMSFELTLNKNLIFINQGISTYNANFKRFIERSSCNYNTLQLHNYNSNEVWKSFRVARRAKVFDLKLINKKNIFQIQAKHDGYRKYGLTHQRSISLKKKELIIKDNIYGKSKLPSFIRFHLNHNIKVKTLTKNKYNLYLENKKIAVISSNNEISIIHKYQNLDFNKSKKNILLLIKIQNNTENIFNAKFH